MISYEIKNLNHFIGTRATVLNMGIMHGTRRRLLALQGSQQADKRANKGSNESNDVVRESRTNVPTREEKHDN